MKFEDLHGRNGFSHFIPFRFDCMTRFQGHILAKELAEKGLQTTVITDSAVFAMISRVNMVRFCKYALSRNLLYTYIECWNREDRMS